ncbi:MAG: amino acid permease, partial [Bacteroidia bacterium]|nr:amino acid permease [Bacteroidia bacterium]
MSNIWRKKPIHLFEEDMKKNELKRVLGKFALTSLGVGAIIGTGIFVLTGVAAHEHAGPALVISFIIAGIGCALAALCYSEFAAILPVEGSAYAYSYGTVGEIFAWLIGWNLILEYAMGSATVAVGWSAYFVKLMDKFGVHFPLWLMYDYGTAVAKVADATANRTLNELSTHFTSLEFPTIAGIPIAINLPAFVIIWIITGILIKGIQEASGANNLMVGIKVGVVLFIILAGAFYVKPENWVPFIPERMVDAQGHAHYGWAGILRAAGIVFFAYIGFDAVSTQAGEAINPK